MNDNAKFINESNPKVEKIIDVICYIPLENWSKSKTTNNYYTKFRDKIISYSYVSQCGHKISIDGIYFWHDNKSKEISELYSNLDKHFSLKEKEKKSDKIDNIYKYFVEHEQ